MKCWCGGDVDSPIGTNNIICKASAFHAPRDTGPTGPVNKLYLSGPMSGIVDCNYPLFYSYAAQLRHVGFAVINPAEDAHGPSYRELLKGDILDLLECDAVAVMEGWWNSTGARLEVQIAGNLQKPVRSVSEWINMAKAGF